MKICKLQKSAGAAVCGSLPPADCASGRLPLSCAVGWGLQAGSNAADSNSRMESLVTDIFIYIKGINVYHVDYFNGLPVHFSLRFRRRMLPQRILSSAGSGVCQN